MVKDNWVNRERKVLSKQSLKNLSRPFRKPLQRDSKQAREWSKLKKKLRKEEYEIEEQF